MWFLKLGGKNIGLQLGTGVRGGWGNTKSWVEDDHEFKWNETKSLCCKCGESLLRASMPVPFHWTIWKCKNGHKFNHVNTD